MKQGSGNGVDYYVQLWEGNIPKPPADAVKAAAARTIAGHATDADDLIDLLTVLGLRRQEMR